MTRPGKKGTIDFVYEGYLKTFTCIYLRQTVSDNFSRFLGVVNPFVKKLVEAAEGADHDVDFLSRVILNLKAYTSIYLSIYLSSIFLFLFPLDIHKHTKSRYLSLSNTHSHLNQADCVSYLGVD